MGQGGGRTSLLRTFRDGGSFLTSFDRSWGRLYTVVPCWMLSDFAKMGRRSARLRQVGNQGIGTANRLKPVLLSESD